MSSTRIPANGNVGIVGLIAAAVLKVDDAELVVLFGGLKWRVSTDKRRSEAMANFWLFKMQARWEKGSLFTWEEDFRPWGPVTFAKLAGSDSWPPRLVDVEATNMKARRNPLLV